MHPVAPAEAKGVTAEEVAVERARPAPAAFETVTESAVDVVALPAASRATAVRVWGPLGAPVVFHETA